MRRTISAMLIAVFATVLLLADVLPPGQLFQKDFSEEWGSSQAGAAVTGSTKLIADQNGLQASLEIRGKAMLFERKPEVGRAEAQAKATLSEGQFTALVRIAGKDVFKVDKRTSFAAGQTLEHTVAKTSFKNTIEVVDLQLQVGPVPVHLRADVGGALELPVSVALAPRSLIATSGARAYALGTLEGGVGWKALAMAKLTADLRMLDSRADLGAQLAPGRIVKRTFTLTIEAARMVVKVAVGIFIEIKFKIFGWKIKVKKELKAYEKTLFDKSWGKRVIDLAPVPPPPPVYTITGKTGEGGVLISAGAYSTVSDKDGNYVLGNLLAGNYSLTASKISCVLSPAVLNVTVGPAQTGKNWTINCPPTWKISATGMPSGTSVVSGFARNPNDVFLFGTRTVPKTPVTEALLYHFDGTTWSQSFALTNAAAVSVFGTGDANTWVVAEYTPNGPSVIYFSADGGKSWANQVLPYSSGITRVGNLSGTGTDIQASAGPNMMIRYDGRQWRLIGAGGTYRNEVPGPLTIISKIEGFYTTCHGIGLWTGSSWVFKEYTGGFCDVTSIVAIHEPKKDLLVLTAGASSKSNGIRAWLLTGKDSIGFLATSSGTATGIWGSSNSDIYMTGSVGATGRLYRWSGQGWRDITATVAALTGGVLPVTTTVFGTAADDVWVALADGRVLRYRR